MAQGQGDGLLRWLIGGLVFGAIVLGLMVAAYEIGYHHGKDHAALTYSPSQPLPIGAPQTVRPALIRRR